MSVITVEKNIAKVEPLYQWDLDQRVEVYGLSLATIPEVHFCHQDMGAALVRQATMDAAGVIRADIPNSLLQKPYKLYAYVCIYEGSTFKTLYKFEIPVKPRAKPADYTLEDDPEVYSFNALENQVVNALAVVNTEHADALNKLAAATTTQKAAEAAYTGAKAEVQSMVAAAVEEGRQFAYTRDETMTAATKALFGLDASAVPDDVFKLMQAQLDVSAQMVVGSYTGTGHYTSGTILDPVPQSLTIPFAPKYVRIFTDWNSTASYVGEAILTPEHGQSIMQDSEGAYEIEVTVSGTTITWVGTGHYKGGNYDSGVERNEKYAMNASGVVYHYVAFG